MWVDGSLRPPEEPLIRVLDGGFAYGRGVFETLRLENGRPVALARHLARLARSAPRLGLPVPAADAVRSAVAEVAGERWDEPVSRLRIQLSATQAGRATLIVTAVEAPASRSAMSAVVVPWVRNERSPLAGLKATCYADSLLALEWAQAGGADEALLADTRGRLSEGSLSNVFVSLDGERLLTPALSTGALPGICREQLLEWSRDDTSSGRAVPIDEVELPVDALTRVREGFLTNSLRGVVPLSHLDGRPLPVPGPLTENVARLYARRYPAELHDARK